MNSERFEITTDIILIDVVKYSLLANEEQLRAVEAIQFDLTKQIHFMGELTNLRNSEVVLGFVSTGDGLYVVVNPQICGYGIPLGLSIRNYLLWLSSNQENALYPGIRVAIHMGKCISFTDVNGSTNYVGDGPNDCARLFSIPDDEAIRFCGDTNYVVASQAAGVWFHKLFKSQESGRFLSTMQFRMSKEFQIVDKHKKIHRAHLVDGFRGTFIQPPNFLRPRKRTSTPDAYTDRLG